MNKIEIKPGMTVFIKTIQKDGVVIGKKDGFWLVQAGTNQVKCAGHQLMPK